jgi:hypothetical protein
MMVGIMIEANESKFFRQRGGGPDVNRIAGLVYDVKREKKSPSAAIGQGTRNLQVVE